MSELHENTEAAVANAAAKIAEAETLEEAQAWQSVISNLTSAVSVLEPELVYDPVEESDEELQVEPVANQSYKDLETDKTRVETGE